MYSPLSFVTDERDNPVAGAVTVTFAPGTAEPVASDTVPEMLPVACPCSNGTTDNVSKRTVAGRTKIFMSIQPLDDICNSPMRSSQTVYSFVLHQERRCCFAAERTRFSQKIPESDRPSRISQFCLFSLLCQGKTG